MSSAGRIGQSRRALPVRCKKTASRSGSVTSTERTAAPASETASRIAGSVLRASSTTNWTCSAFVLTSWTLGSARHAAEALDVAREREEHLVPLADRAHELPPGALRLQLAQIEDPDAVAQALGLLHVVRRVQDGHASGGQPVDALQDGVAALRIDPHGRLVQDQQPRPVEQPDPDVQPPFHATRVLLGGIVCPVGEADDPEDLVHPSRQVVAVHAVQASEEAEVLAARQVRVDREILRT